MINSFMEDEIYQITPIADVADRAQQRRIIWLFAVTFVAINVVTILGSLMSPELAANVVLIGDMIFWFNMSILGIIGSYFGIDIVSSFISSRAATLKRMK